MVLYSYNLCHWFSNKWEISLSCSSLRSKPTLV